MTQVVFMGTPDFAVAALQALLDADGYEVQAVFTQPDKPKGRSKVLQMPPVKETAAAAGIPVYQPLKIRDSEWAELLAKLNPDVIVVTAFGQIIPQTILDIPRYGCINVHASLLPKYRGAAPIQWALINGDAETGVTTMRMDAGLDTGDMIMKESVPIAVDETGGSLFEKLGAVGARLLIDTLNAVADGTAKYEEQPKESPTEYARMLTKEDGRIDWEKDAKTLSNLIRGLNPQPCAFTKLNGKTLKIWDAKALPEEKSDAEAGTVCAVTKSSLQVQTGSGVLSILELQMEGKKRMPADAFLRGCPLKVGDRLGE